MWTMQTLASEMLAAEIAALKASGVADPLAECAGIQWLQGRIDIHPKMDLRFLLEQYKDLCDGDRWAGNWSCGLLKNQGERLPEEWRRFCLSVITPAGMLDIVQSSVPLSPSELHDLESRRVATLLRHRDRNKGDGDA